MIGAMAGIARSLVFVAAFVAAACAPASPTAPVPPAAAGVPNLSGTYTLTLTTDVGCESPMPDPFRVRTYGATLTHVGNRISVSLSRASFFIVDGRGNGFVGLIDATNHVTFNLTDNDHFGAGGNPDVVEQLGGASVLALALTFAVRRLGPRVEID